MELQRVASIPNAGLNTEHDFTLLELYAEANMFVHVSTTAFIHDYEQRYHLKETFA